MDEQIRAAIEAAVGNDERGAFEPRTPSDRSVRRARTIIKRFIENLEDESMTVLELRNAFDS